MSANDPQYVRTVLRERGMCGEISPDKRSTCIQPATLPHEHCWEERDTNPHGFRTFTIDTVGNQVLRVKECDDGARFEIWKDSLNPPTAELTATGLVELVNQIAGWFNDDPPKTIVANLRSTIERLSEMIEAYNAEAERMGGDFVPYQDLHNHAAVALETLRQLEKVFGKS